MANKLKVDELRTELTQRGLSTIGTKPTLVRRLESALRKEDKQLSAGYNRERRSRDGDSNGPENINQPIHNFQNMGIQQLRQKPTLSHISASGSNQQLPESPSSSEEELNQDSRQLAEMILKIVQSSNPKKLKADKVRTEHTQQGLSTARTKTTLVQRLESALHKEDKQSLVGNKRQRKSKDEGSNGPEKIKNPLHKFQNMGIEQLHQQPTLPPISATESDQQLLQSLTTPEGHQLVMPAQRVTRLIESHESNPVVVPETLPSNKQAGVGHRTSSSGKKRRTRGPTRNLRLAFMPHGKKIHVEVNDHGQPIGEHATTFANYIGCIVRSSENAPLQVKQWEEIPIENFEKMWMLILEKFDVGEEHKKWVFQSMSTKFRCHRNHLKQKYYTPYNTDEERLLHNPPHVSEDDWRWLVQYWSTPESQAVSQRNKANRGKHVMPHTSGTKSFARLRHEQTKARADGNEPSPLEMFRLTHSKKDGTPISEKSRQIIAQFEELSSQQGEGSNFVRGDLIWTKVMGPKRRGRVHSFGLATACSSGQAVVVREIDEMKREMEELRSQHSSQIEELRSQHCSEIEELRGQMQSQMTSFMEEMKRQVVSGKQRGRK